MVSGLHTSCVVVQQGQQQGLQFNGWPAVVLGHNVTPERHAAASAGSICGLALPAAGAFVYIAIVP